MPRIYPRTHYGRFYEIAEKVRYESLGIKEYQGIKENLTNYYLNHPTKVNSGLVLPHSGLLSYLVFVGVAGILYFIFYLSIKIYKNKENFLYVTYLVFFILNILKSDSLLYINNFILFIFILNADQINFNLSKINKPGNENINVNL